MANVRTASTNGPDIGIEALTELTLNLRWAWHHGTDELWAQLDPELWAQTRNPSVVLQTVSRSRLRDVLSRPDYRTRVMSLLAERRDYLAAPAWFQLGHPGSSLTRVAYFSMEFALSEALPIYSGGLGNVAGDQLKAASDLGVPVVGVGLLYQQGYFRQAIAAEYGAALHPHLLPELSGQLAMCLRAVPGVPEPMAEDVEDAGFGSLGALADDSPVRIADGALTEVDHVGLGIRFS